MLRDGESKAGTAGAVIPDLTQSSTSSPTLSQHNAFPPAVPTALDGKNNLVKTLNGLNP